MGSELKKWIYFRKVSPKPVSVIYNSLTVDTQK